MDVIKTKVNFHDDRGDITDILYNEPIEHVTMITSKAGVVRGNHYHKETIQWSYVQTGKIKAYSQNGEEAVESKILLPGDMIKSDVYQKHALEALEDSVLLIFTRGPRGGEDYEDDTYRLESPLQEGII